MQDGFWLYIGSILVGLFFGLISRKANSTEAFKVRLYQQLEFYAVKALLPTHIFLTIIISQGLLNLANFFLLILSGIFFSVIAIVFAHFITRLSIFKSECYPHLQYAAGTFGGGGRAIVLIAALQPFIAANSNLSTSSSKYILIDTLAIFDLGYWLFFCTVIYSFVMPLSFKTKIKHSKENSSPLNIGHVMVLIASIASFIIVFIGREKFISFLGGIEIVSYARTIVTALIVIFASTAFGLRFEHTKFGSSLFYIILIFLIRFFAFILPLFFIFFAYPEFFKLLIIPVVILLVSPPSSFLQFMLSDRGASEKSTKQILNINASWNIIYFGFVIILVSISLLIKLISIL